MTSAIADRIASLMNERSEAAFARKCGISQPLLRKYLAGSQPRIDKLLAISDATGVTLEWLASGKEPKFMTCGAINEPSTLHRQDRTEVRAEDIPLRRFFSLAEDAWMEPEIRGWLEPTLKRVERDLLATFPEWSEKKLGTPCSNDGAA